MNKTTIELAMPGPCIEMKICGNPVNIYNIKTLILDGVGEIVGYKPVVEEIMVSMYRLIPCPKCKETMRIILRIGAESYSNGYRGTCKSGTCRRSHFEPV